jgi:ARG and Rhodanese-Phosphatase-superfamily-associated Protein domain
MNAADIVIGAVQRVEFGSLTSFRNLGLLALSTASKREADYLTLDEALQRHAAHIVEVNEGGRVPELKIVNEGERSVLLLDGEELLGAKQNRVLNLTILAPGHRTCVVPVSCVESGRWHHVSHGFEAAPRAHFAEGRAEKMRHVTSSMRTDGSRSSDQQAVWSQIAEKSARLGAVSDTSAMSAMFDAHHASLEEFVAALTPVEGQVGAVFLVNGRAAGLELFDAPSTWRTLAPKLIRSYALDALDQGDNPVQSNAAAEATALIHGLMSSQASVFPAVGEGEDVRFDGAGAFGAALVTSEMAIHVSAFPVESAGTRSRYKGPRARRNGSS